MLAGIRTPSARALLTLAAVLTVVYGCSTSPAPVGPVVVPVDVKDDGASAGSVRLAWRPSGADPGTEGGGAEIGYTRYSGSTVQTLQSWERVVVGGTIADGPQRLRHEVDIRSLDLVYTYTFVISRERFFASASKRPVELTMFVGLEKLRFGLDSEGNGVGTPHLNREVDVRGLFAGAAPRLHFSERVSLDARLSLAYLNERGSYLGGSDVQKRGTELTLAFRPIKHLELRGGYFWTRVEMTEMLDDSKVSASLRGPFLGVDLKL